LSYAPDGSVEKVERQEGDCRQLAERLGWPVSEQHVFPDNSRSAWQRNRRRPQWDRMLKAIDAGEIDAVIVYHGDRLIRQPYDLETMISIADQKGIRIASPSGTRDLDNADDRFILRIEAAQACRESDNISRRTKRGHAARAVKGRGQSGGKRPFGWGAPTGRTRIRVDRATGDEREVPVLDYNQTVPEETEYLIEAADRILAGLSLAGAVRWLNEAKVTTSQGGPWTSRVLRSLLISPRVVGLIEREGIFYEAAWKPVIPRETWEDLRALFARNKEASTSPGGRRVHLLSGVAECGSCGSNDIRTKPMGGKRRNKLPGYAAYRVYYCRACHGVGRNLALLDAYVDGRIVGLLNDSRFFAEVQSNAVSGRPGIGAEIAALERRKEEQKEKLDALADHPDVDADVAVLGLASYDRKIAGLRNQLAASANQRLIARMIGITHEQWRQETVDVRSTVVRILYRVVILPATQSGPGFDPESVSLERRPLGA
jgi:DNA invertase Pin-like site-specific DNA recombinase